ncbi:4-fold beta flower protein [Pseudomonas costantinii]
MRPVRRLKPLKGLKRLKPLKHLRRLAPLRPMLSNNWSQLSGQQFFL